MRWHSRGGVAGLALIALLLVCAEGRALPLPANGLYETWSPLTRRPVGPISLSQAQRLLPRWLSVTSSGKTSVVTFMPAGRVRWRISWGPDGIATKVTEVDGVRYSASEFDYRDGHLFRKRIERRGQRWAAFFKTDSSGRLRTRRETMPSPNDGRTPRTPAIESRWSVRHNARTVVIARSKDGKLVRRDTLDLAGRPLRVELGFDGKGQPMLALAYRRDSRGVLTSIGRTLFGVHSRANPAQPDPTIRSKHVAALARSAFVERHEALLLLGAPVTHRDQKRGDQRRIDDHYSKGCWLNAVSTLHFDAAGLLLHGGISCICGFCVDARLPVRAPDNLGVDLHFTRGPWIRLDGRVDVTADHRLLTPSGPRRAGDLRAGELVLAADGSPHRLRSVVRLARGPLRLGRNISTRRGYFVAGGLRFESEPPTACRLSPRRLRDRSTIP